MEDIRIADFLPTGRDNAVTAAYICSMLGIDKRQLRDLCEKERRENEPVCASTDPKTGGYFLAEYRDEMQEYVAHLNRQLDEMTITAQACSKTCEKLPERTDVVA